MRWSIWIEIFLILQNHVLSIKNLFSKYRGIFSNHDFHYFKTKLWFWPLKPNKHFKQNLILRLNHNFTKFDFKPYFSLQIKHTLGSMLVQKSVIEK